VLIYPYYTVNAGLARCLLVNTTPAGKALKVRIHEGYNGRDVLDFNLYLSPFGLGRPDFRFEQRWKRRRNDRDQ
jgi:hypothetical protein